MGLNLSIYDIIKKPVITEKSTYLREKYNQYVFYVHPKANKIQIKEAVEKLFNVKVEKVNIVKLKGKLRRRGFNVGRTPQRKKAIVKVKEGQKIKIFEA
ncbi:MAG: 50S ribosomal protein L23 [Caldiserica bacterium]|nr:MAG: 50S ribosomal protein L23 [Caldisericota bacterium]